MSSPGDSPSILLERAVHVSKHPKNKCFVFIFVHIVPQEPEKRSVDGSQTSEKQEAGG